MHLDTVLLLDGDALLGLHLIGQRQIKSIQNMQVLILFIFAIRILHTLLWWWWDFFQCILYLQRSYLVTFIEWQVFETLCLIV